MAVRLKDRIEANIRQSDKVNNSLSIQLNGGTATVYNGSAAKSINVTPAAIGAPSTDGTGASGTWNITSTSTQRLLSTDTRNTSIIPTETLTGLVADFKAKGTVGITASGSYVGVLTWRSYSTAADLSGGQPIQIAYTQDNELQTRLGNTSTWGSWTKLLNSNNYTSYTVKKDGTGASGTWGISITGNAATATALTSSAGSTSRPIYFSSGKPAQITLTLPAVAITTGFDTAFRTSINGSTSVSPFLGVVRTDTASVTYAPQYGSGVVWGRGDTHGYLSVSYNGGTAYLGGGSADKLNWCKRIAFTDSNVASADKLKTARTISLTGAVTGSGSFDGSGNLSIDTSYAVSFEPTQRADNKAGYRLIGTSGTGAWNNKREIWLVASRHTGCGLLSFIWGHNANDTTAANAYGQIVYIGPKTGGTIFYKDAFQIYYNETNATFYLFWKYTDYNSTRIIKLLTSSGNWTLANGADMDSISTATYGTLICQTTPAWLDGESITNAVWN